MILMKKKNYVVIFIVILSKLGIKQEAFKSLCHSPDLYKQWTKKTLKIINIVLPQCSIHCKSSHVHWFVGSSDKYSNDD
jgi:hypothetical protein